MFYLRMLGLWAPDGMHLRKGLVMTHTPGPWEAVRRMHDSSIPAEWEIADEHSPFWIAIVLSESNARLIAISPDLLSDQRHTIAWLTRFLETKLAYIPDSDQSGHPHGYSVVQIPDWEVKQKLDSLKETLARLEPKGASDVVK
jgi:hypothetical protein